ncbi:MAG: methionine biosynthesis protein MetW [Betaproteobacteria bacterium]|nr:methionine biosynthesis protein MetW [Betaproteobacteria bacterium]
MSNGNGHNLRADYAVISAWVGAGTRVLDLGCGDGTLLRHLRTDKQVFGYGIEIDDANVLAALANGNNVIQSDLERGLAAFGDAGFDCVILSQTLQAMHHIEAVLLEMVRVGREAIVTFPNFGYAPNREQVAAGRMPVSKILPFAWYNTPNIHLCTMLDFEELCAKLELEILDLVALTEGKPVADEPNLNGELAIYRVKRR